MYLASYLQNKSVVEAENFPYIEASTRSVLPITVAEIQQHIRIDDPLEQVSYLENLIKSAIYIFESYTNISIINQTWFTYRNNFYDVPVFELRKGRFFSLELFQYLKNGLFVSVDPNSYYIPPSSEYSQIMLKPDKEWPQDADYQRGAIKIKFTAGLSAESANVPNDVKTCLYNLTAFLYDNRGNNDIAGIGSRGMGAEGSGLNAIPNHSAEVINRYRIQDFFGGFFIGF